MSEDTVQRLMGLAREAIRSAVLSETRGGRNYEQDADEDLEALESALREALMPAGWISVEDRLPEPDTGEVLVWMIGGYCVFDEWHMHREDPTGMSTTHTMEMGLMWRDHEFEEVTHWMPLPAAPAFPVELEQPEQSEQPLGDAADAAGLSGRKLPAIPIATGDVRSGE